ncbi:MAG: c-type cytochrome [Acidobacteriia bacterium]|nr:c-type cytochrome [Terriglobia bacterium]
MWLRNSFCLTAVLAFAIGARAQEPSKAIERTPVQQTSPASGHEMFTSYCASCHGKDAKGNGPAASALKTAPADLTALAKKNGGKYPSLKVTSVLSGQTDLAAHGNKEMPVWGAVFWRMSGGHEGEVQQRVANLNRYIESLQGK